MTINFATVADVERRLQRTLDGDEVDQAEEYLGDASDLIRAESGRTWLNETEDALDGTAYQLAALSRVCSAMAARVMRNPGGATQRTAGPFSESFVPQAVSTSVYFTKAERKIVASVSGKAGLAVMGTTRGEWETALIVTPPTVVDEPANDWLVLP